jgi:hypothetical protein
MKTIIIMLALLIPLYGMAGQGKNPKRVEVTNFPAKRTMQFVGVTSRADNRGGAGIIAMTVSCQVEYTGSRVCTSSEILNSTNVPMLTEAAAAWVRPDIVASRSTVSWHPDPVYYPLDYPGDLTDASGFSAQSGDLLTCQGWSNSHPLYSGLTVTQHGQFRTRPCGDYRPVACCAWR